MLVNGRNYGFNRHGINQLLKSVLLSVDLVVLPDLEEPVPLGIVLNFCIEELRPFDAPAFKVLDPGGRHSFLLFVITEIQMCLAAGIQDPLGAW